VLFFCPLFYYGYQLLDEGTYYRILWLLPMTATIAYSMVKILGRYPAGTLALGILLIVLSGNYIYSNQYISAAENAYHLPQESIEVCDLIMPAEEEENVKGVFPDELIHYVRQYTSRILMAYGRDYLAPDWKYGDHPLRTLMNSEVIAAGKLAKLATEYDCHYIVLEKDKRIQGNLEKMNIIKIGETQNYYIYRNTSVDILRNKNE
jgi:hypothetical protein